MILCPLPINYISRLPSRIVCQLGKGATFFVGEKRMYRAVKAEEILSKPFLGFVTRMNARGPIIDMGKDERTWVSLGTGYVITDCKTKNGEWHFYRRMKVERWLANMKEIRLKAREYLADGIGAEDERTNEFVTDTIG